MWKWIVGGLLVVVVALAATCYVTYKKFTSGGDSAMVTVAASPDRVFASLADADSMASFMGRGMTMRATHHGLVVVGDTLHVETENPTSKRGQHFTWIVSDVQPAHLLVLEMRDDSTGHVFASRRDSLVASGDSTLIVSTIASPMMDSLKTERGDTGRKMGGAILNFASKIVINGFRVAAEQQLRELKKHVEAGAKRP